MKAYIKSISYALPENIEENPLGRLSKKTGIYKRHIANKDEIASDLAVRAAEKMFKKVAKEKIDMLLYCTQSPDYILPTTACILQNRLGLSRHIGALDFNLGCSGYIYGLSLAKGLIESGQAKNVLLITAETYSKYINPKDNSVRPLFGDGATATLITAVDTVREGLTGFTLGTDGSGYSELIVPAGGQAEPIGENSAIETTDDFGNIRSRLNLCMNGSKISEFALEIVPAALNEILAKTNLTRSDIGYFIFHQANKFILDFLQQKCDLVGYPYWNDVKNYGNTVSSSIPIAIADMLKGTQLKNPLILSIGFGVGLSWGGCIIDTSYLNNDL